MGKRVTKAELENRVDTIHDMLVLGVRRADICRFVSEKTEWDITERQIDRYIADATELIKAAGELDREAEIATMKERLELLWRKDMQIQDYKAALAVLKERGSLLGIYAPDKKEVTGKDSGPIIFEVVYDD